MLKEKIADFFLRHLAIPKTPKVIEGRKHIACIGDSITFGAGVNGKKEETWEYYLEHLLDDGTQVINYGISGRTLQDEGDYPYKADKFYAISKEIKADLYLIMLGTNDAKPYNWNAKRYADELKSFLKEYIELENRPEVIVMIPPECFVNKSLGKVAFDIDKEVIDYEIPDIIKNTAADLSLEVIDLLEYTHSHEEWFADGVHPNNFGNQFIAMQLHKKLKRTGKDEEAGLQSLSAAE